MRILVVKNRALGDAIMGLSTLQYLKSVFPQCEITYGVPCWIGPLFKNIDLGFQVRGFDFKKTVGIKSLLDHFLLNKYDAVIELHQSGRSGKILKICSKLFGFNYIFHNHNTLKGEFILDQGVRKPSIQRDLDCAWTFANQLGITKVPTFLDFEPRMNFSTNKKSKIIILGVVATRETKKYPLQNYLELCQKIYSEKPDYKIVIPLSPSVDDRKIKGLIDEMNFPINVDVLSMSLDNLRDFFFKSKYYIGNDTGLKHLAIAAGCESYTLFGPEEPLEWHPYSREQHQIYFRKPLECRVIKSHYCGLSQCDSMICLNTQKASDIYSEVLSSLD